MTFEEFRAVFPAQKMVTVDNFPQLLIMAEVVVQDLMVYDVNELTDAGLEIYNTALALQIDHIATEGATEGNITSQTVNGVSMSFALSGAGTDAARVSSLARLKLRSAGLCVRF